MLWAGRERVGRPDERALSSQLSGCTPNIRKCTSLLPLTAPLCPTQQVAPGTVIGEEEALAAAALAAGQDSVGVKGFATIDQVGAAVCLFDWMCS